MKEKTLIKIKMAVNSLIKNKIKLSVRTLSTEAKTSKDNVLDFFKLYPKESFNKHYKTGTLNTVPVLDNVPDFNVPDLDAVPDSNVPDLDSVPVLTVPDSNVPVLTVPDLTVPDLDSVPVLTVPVLTVPVLSVPVLSVPVLSVPDLDSVPDSNVPVSTSEGFIHQLNKLLKTGIINKDYYKNQIAFSKNNYPKSFQFLYE